MAKILSVGAAVQDVFLSGSVFKAVCELDGTCAEELPLGAKLEVENVVISTGGGATNAAVTFARQGHDSQFVGVVGKDIAGDAIIKALEDEQVAIDKAIRTDRYHTGYSTILLSTNGERTILTYRGASEHFIRNDFELEDIDAEWLYITSLAGNMELLEYLLILAEHIGMKVAIDPGKHELDKSAEMKQLLPKLTVLKANRDELGQLASGSSAEDIARELSEIVPYVIVTDGAAGCVATDHKDLLRAGMYEDVQIVDRTGAGDAFGSGLVAWLAAGKTLREAVVFGSANATSVVLQVGAKAGILKGEPKLHDMPIETLSI
jgi:sugar/nucleoside kinase (ribokinase family)